MFGGYHRGGSWRELPPQVPAAQSPRGHHISLGWSPVARARRSRLAVLPCEHQSANKSSGASTGDHRSGLAMAGLRRERSFSLSAGRWQFGGFRLDLPAPVTLDPSRSKTFSRTPLRCDLAKAFAAPKEPAALPLAPRSYQPKSSCDPVNLYLFRRIYIVLLATLSPRPMSPVAAALPRFSCVLEEDS